MIQTITFDSEDEANNFAKKVCEDYDNNIINPIKDIRLIASISDNKILRLWQVLYDDFQVKK